MGFVMFKLYCIGALLILLVTSCKKGTEFQHIEPAEHTNTALIERNPSKVMNASASECIEKCGDDYHACRELVSNAAASISGKTLRQNADAFSELNIRSSDGKYSGREAIDRFDSEWIVVDRKPGSSIALRPNSPKLSGEIVLSNDNCLNKYNECREECK